MDENVSLLASAALMRLGHEVTAVCRTEFCGSADEGVWEFACRENALLVTRDMHFCKAARFPAERCLGIIVLRPGTLSAAQEAQLLLDYFQDRDQADLQKRLVMLSPSGVEIR